MRTIKKSVEPQFLAQHRLGGGTYGNLSGALKARLRDSLVQEQRGICCYCMGRIRAEWGQMRIEHFASQSEFPDRRLDYANLLAACPGAEGTEEQHCDVARSDVPLSRNPTGTAGALERLIRYVDGEMATDDLTLQADIDLKLNLNCQTLQEQRRSTLTAFVVDYLPRVGQPGRATLERWLADWNGDDATKDLRPYCQVVVYWLEKKLRRLG